MFKTLIAATGSLMLMMGLAAAQSGYSSSTTETTREMTPPRHSVDETTTTRRTETRNGVLIEKDTTGDETLAPGRAETTETRTDTTTVR